MSPTLYLSLSLSLSLSISYVISSFQLTSTPLIHFMVFESPSSFLLLIIWHDALFIMYSFEEKIKSTQDDKHV